MPITPPKLNINGEMVDFRDLKKIADGLTLKDQQRIKKLQDDIVSLDNKRAAYGELEDLMKSLQSSAMFLRTTPSGLSDDVDIFNKKTAAAVGMTTADFVTYADIDVQQEAQLGRVSLSITQTAQAAKWQSQYFSSKVVSVTQQSGGTNQNMFTAGTFSIMIPNNGQAFTQIFSSGSIVGTDTGQFKTGSFFINDTTVSLSSGMTLDNLVTQINNLNIGVTASAESATGGQTLALRSNTIGAQNSFTIHDPDSVFTQLTLNSTSDGYLDPLQDYKTITLEYGDNLNRIAYKINTIEQYTNLHTDVVQTAKDQYRLVLTSLATGADNTFTIDDNGVILNGTNGGSVFGTLFSSANSQATNVILQQPQDAIIIVDGIEIHNALNSIKVLTGVNINAKAATSSTLMFDVQADWNGIFGAITTFSQKYNDLVQFCQKQQAINKDGTIPKDSVLKDDSKIFELSMQLSNILSIMEQADIGISRDTITVQSTEDGKNITRTYSNIMKIDNDKLLAAIQKDAKMIKQTFDYNFESTSTTFSSPLFKKSIYVNNTPMGNKRLDVNISIDLDDIDVKSKSTVNFADASNVVSSSDINKFSPGQFFINNYPITISNGMSLNDIVTSINSVSSMSRISAAIIGSAGQYYIQLNKYSGLYPATDDQEKFDNINIYDPNNILKDLFSTSRRTSDFDVSDTSTSSSQIAIGQSLIVNGVNITLQGNTLADVISNINAQTSISRVKVESDINPLTGKMFLRFKSNKLDDISMDNSANAITTTITPIYAQQMSNKFFDVNNAIDVQVSVAQGLFYKKLCNYTLYGSDINGVGKITVLNGSSDKQKIDNLEIIYSGAETKIETQISIVQGAAEMTYSLIDNDLKPKIGYGFISASMTNIDNKKSSIVAQKVRDEEYLQDKQKSIIKKHAKAITTFDEADAYAELADAMLDYGKKK